MKYEGDIIMFLIRSTKREKNKIKEKNYEDYLKDKTSQIFCVISGILGLVGLIFCFVLSRLGTHLDLGSLSVFIKYNVEIIAISIVCCILFLTLLVLKNRIIETKGLKIKHLISSFILVIVCSYLILCITIYSFQDELISKNNLIFQPHKITKEMADMFVQNNVEEITLTASHNIKLHGWLVKNSTKEKSPLIIYFGGCGQEVSNMVEEAKKLKGWSVALINYRGFGLSEGSPSQYTSFNDATLIYDILSKRKDIDNKKIVSMGWSLGTAVAAYLSDNRPIKGTVLVSPIDSEFNRFQASIPFIPLSVIMKQSFDSMSRASSVNTPLLCLIGDSDTNVSTSASLRLVDRWNGTHIVKDYKNEDHYLLFHDNNSWLDILNFLKILK